MINNCPFVELSNFSFENRYADRATRFYQNLSWRNIGSQPLVAFEIVILKYDPFNRRLIGSPWTVTGKNSADWRPLALGESNRDGTTGYGDEEVFTAIAYVDPRGWLTALSGTRTNPRFLVSCVSSGKPAGLVPFRILST